MKITQTQFYIFVALAAIAGALFVALLPRVSKLNTAATLIFVGIAFVIGGGVYSGISAKAADNKDMRHKEVIAMMSDKMNAQQRIIELKDELLEMAKAKSAMNVGRELNRFKEEAATKEQLDSTNEEIEKLKEKIEELREENKNLRKKVSIMEEQLDDTRGKLDAIENMVSAMVDRIMEQQRRDLEMLIDKPEMPHEKEFFEDPPAELPQIEDLKPIVEKIDTPPLNPRSYTSKSLFEVAPAKDDIGKGGGYTIE
jgi:predicted RNase H-like nuclease (RuvC/YqgF family)